MFYQEHTQYSPTHDCEITRLSVAPTVDDLRSNDPFKPELAGREFFCLIPRLQYRRWRATRERALEQIQQAISAGQEPGEVTVILDA